MPSLKRGTSYGTTAPAPLTASPALERDLLCLLEGLEDGVIVLDRAWRIIYANESARRISHIEPHQVNGINGIDGPSHWELYPDTVGTAQEAIYRRSMEQRVALEHEFYYPPHDIWISLRTVPVSSGIAVYYRDISRLKRVEAEGDASGRRLEQVFEATSDGIVLLDRNYNFTFLNRRAREMLEPSGDALGKNLWTAYPGVVYEDSPFVLAYHRAMDEGIASCFEAYYGEPLNLWLAVEAHPAENGIIIFFRDITEQRCIAEGLRRKTEEAERQAAEIETVYRTAPIGLALFDPVEFRYQRLNERQAAFFGLKPEEVVGRTLTEMAPIPGLRELFEQVVAGTPVVNFPLEGELISHPGEHRYWTVNYSPVFATDGSVQAVSAASLEITQQKKAERALMQSEKLAAAGRLASSISHEINNPLESVTNLLYLIAMNDRLLPEIRTYIDTAQAELARVSHIATQTLRFQRQSAHLMQVMAAQVIDPVIAVFERRLANAGVEVATRFAATASFSCYDSEIRQVLSNLVTNAIDAMREGGRISFRTHDAVDRRTGRRGIRIVVADNGTGMTAATRARIFEPFFTTKEFSGTGLGLWISAEIIQRHQGRLTVRSCQGSRIHGTVFSLFLPREQG